MNCYNCETELNPIQEPRIYESDLDPRDVQGEEYCCDCYEELDCEYCEICKEEFPDGSFCDHLFWSENGTLGAGAYLSDSDKKYIASQVRTAWYYILKAMKERDYPIEYIKEFQSDVATLLANHSLQFGTYGSCFGDEALRVLSIGDAKPYMSDLVFYSDDMWEKSEKLADGGKWLMTLDAETKNANQQTLKWIQNAGNRFFRLNK
jgi:hypothetical protein